MSSPRLHVITGKGGTGKTTVAAALACALASSPGGRTGPRRVLLAEAEGRQGLAGLFDHAPLGVEPTLLTAADGGQVHGLAVDVEHAFIAYLNRIVGGARHLRPLLRRFGVVDFATQVMPGLRDLLLLDPVVAATQARSGGRPEWDAVVLDAPPTGRIARFLSVADEVVTLTKVGGLAVQAGQVTQIVRSPTTAVHLVTLLEPMAVQETVDAGAELTAEGYPLGAVVANQVADDRAVAALTPAGGDELDAARLGRAIADAGWSIDDEDASELVRQVGAHARHVASEDVERQALAALGLPIAELPRLGDQVDRAGLDVLAQLLGPSFEARA